MKKLLLAAVLTLVAYLAFWPVPIEPVAWTPPSAPPAEAYPANERLRGIERLAEGYGRGGEGVAIDAQGRLYVGYDDGRIVRLDTRGANPSMLANTGGRPLGLCFDPDGRLVIADALKGLLRLKEDGQIETLATSAEGLDFKLVDDADAVPGEPYIYFTDASARFGIHEVMNDALEHRGSGRLLRYDIRSGETLVLMRDLQFANGVTLGPGAEYVLVNETTAYRIQRYWLKGEKAGTSEILIDNLPGFPDNLSFNGRDRFWVALYAPRKRELDAMAPYPWVRKVVARLPAFVQPRTALQGWVLGLDLDGKVVANLQYAGEGAFGPITSAEEQGDYLWLGTLSDTAVGRIPLKDL